MVKLALVVFAVIVFVCLAFQVAIHSQEFRWAAGAVAAYMAASLPIPDVGVPSRNKE